MPFIQVIKLCVIIFGFNCTRGTRFSRLKRHYTNANGLSYNTIYRQRKAASKSNEAISGKIKKFRQGVEDSLTESMEKRIQVLI